jgi:hypothetical protein
LCAGHTLIAEDMGLFLEKKIGLLKGLAAQFFSAVLCCRASCSAASAEAVHNPTVIDF